MPDTPLHQILIRPASAFSSLVDFVAQFPAEILAKVRETSDGFLATVDCGPNSYISDADAPHYGATPQAACEQIKAWLLDDLAKGGKLGKPQYQPHWDTYDIQYRLGAHWRSKLQVLARERQAKSDI